MRVHNNGNVGVGTATPSATAILELASTTKGFAPPRMTTTQRLAMGTIQGLFVFDITTQKLYCYNGSAWEAVGTGTVGSPPIEHRQTFAAAGGSQQFTLSSPYVVNGVNLKVFVNGSLQEPVTNYTEDTTTKFTIPAGLVGGETVTAIWTTWP